jgi:Hsp20/alpha crystallin family
LPPLDRVGRRIIGEGELMDGPFGPRRVTYARCTAPGRFERGFALPEGATGEGITASYRDGVLEVVVPKAIERAEPRQIPVSAAEGKTALPISRHAA